MADNIPITAGSGTSIATDDESSVHFQKVKLASGITGETAGIGVDVGVKANAIRTAPASDIDDATYIGDIKFGESLPAGTAAIGKLAANSGVDIGDVDVLSSALPTGAATAAKQLADGHNVTVDNASGASAVNIQDGGNSITVDGTVTETNSAAIKTAVEIIDNAISGSEMQVDVVAALPAGTNAIGKLAANSGVDIGDVDVLSIAAGDNNIGNVDIVTIPNAVVDGNHFHATITSADATTATSVKAKTAAKKIYVTSLMISVGATAIEVQLQSDNGTPQVVMEEIFLAANGGLTWSSADPKLPLFIVNTNEDLDVITSASGDVTVAVSGYVV